MDSKFLRSEDYDKIIEEVLKEGENPFGLLQYTYHDNKEKNPDFLKFTVNAIHRKQSSFVKIWNEILLANPEKKLEEVMSYTPDYYFLREMENYLNELENPDIRKDNNNILPPLEKLKSVLNQEQFALLFYFLKKTGIISTKIDNKQIAKSIQFITGYSYNRLYKKIKTEKEPSFKISNRSSDFEILKNKLKKMIDEIQRDIKQHSKEGELK